MGEASMVWHAWDEGFFLRVGEFLAEHRLTPDPGHYRFAHRVIADPSGPLAVEVARLTAGGGRLDYADVKRLAGHVRPVATTPASDGNRDRAAMPAAERQAHQLVAETQAQVDGFADIVRAMRRDTHGFGQDLAQSAAAIEGTAPTAVEQLSRIASTMIARVQDSESRLARATDETDRLRAKLTEARDAARRDPLTSLPNRLALSEAFAAREGDKNLYCLALCDVDRFKRINDQHGHGVGDRVLNMIGQTLAEQCRGHLVTRYGGEEFAILMKGLNLADAARLLDRARASIAAKRLRNRETDEAIGIVTFSGGVTAIRAQETMEESADRADKLLYTAKSQGRDRICAR